MQVQEGVQFPPPVGWTEIAKSLPVKPCQEREDKLINYALTGSLLPIEWTEILVEGGGHSITFYAPADALKLGTQEDSCRFNVTATGAQILCDALELVMPTSKIADIIHQRADVILTPCPQTPDAQMAYTARMTQHSRAVDKKIAGRRGLIDTVGKYWVITNKLLGFLNKAANFGWHVVSSQFRSPGGLYVLQPLGTAHDRWHVDYSQIFRPMHSTCIVDGVEARLVDVLVTPELAPLLSDEGALKLTRMLGVEVQNVA